MKNKNFVFYKTNSWIFTFGLVMALATSFRLHASVPNYCSDAGLTFVPIPDSLFRNGAYMRVHPYGKYVIFSSGLEAHIVDLTEKNGGKINPKVVQTPLRNEAYPVEGTWRIISSYNDHDGVRTGMGYYSFKDLLAKQRDAKLFYLDSNHNQYYSSSAELPDSSAKKIHFRTQLWSSSSKDYTVALNSDGSLGKVTEGTKRTLCANIGQLYSVPILSKDGTELSTQIVGQSTLKILSIHNDGTCSVEEDLQVAGSKANFSYPVHGKKGSLVFADPDPRAAKNGRSSDNVIFSYDRDKKKMKRISSPWLDSYPSYPGYTKDGRIIYKTTRNGVPGIVIADPSKIPEVPAFDPKYPDKDLYSVCAQEVAAATNKAPEAGSH